MHVPRVVPLALLALGIGAACTDGGEPRSDPDASTASAPPSIDDLPECDPVEPSFECVTELFRPLDDGDWPFDAERVGGAFRRHETYVAPEFRLTALHVLEAESRFPFACFLEEFRFAPEGGTIDDAPGCGEVVFVGGHPQAAECERDGTTMARCVDQVPFDEAFDISLSRAEPNETWLDPWTDPPEVGDRVFLVGSPSFQWLGEEEQRSLEDLYPLVSSGEVLAVEGRGIVTSNLAFDGASGGALLNERGEIVGVVYTVVRDLRSEGTAVTETLEDHREVSVYLDERMREAVLAAQRL